MSVQNCNFYKVFKYKYLLTVCKSRRNNIKVIKPETITKGVKLNNANSFPNIFPVNNK